LALRPGDWSLRDKQAAFLHAQGDSGAAERSLKEAEKLVDDQIRAGGDCLMLRQNQFRNRAAAFGRAAELNPGNQSIADQLAQTQLTLAALDSGQDGDLCR
jgi:Flp pilus assembly protein TadD